MELNDLLLKSGIEPGAVLVMRHRPTEPRLRKILPVLAEDRPDLYNAYQQTQKPLAEAALARVDYLASFIGHEGGKALFVGLYRKTCSRPLSYRNYWRMPVHKELRAMGMTGFDGRRGSVCAASITNPQQRQLHFPIAV